jgi:kinesin family protein 11
MVGEEQPNLSGSWEDPSGIGIIPRALCHLFDDLRLMDVEFAMRVSYLELYNEELCDLLSTDDSTKIRIFDDSTKKGSVIVQGLEEIPVKSKDDVYKLLAKGQERRKTAATLMNAQSSRSHTVFSILVHIKENNVDGEEMLKIGKLNLVDLAGSENISKAGNEKGIRTRETVNINQSLLTLGRVITALVEKTPHVPYRESKLTRLLQESLGGRTKTSIIATVSPGHKDLDETMSTLDYAHRAKNIQNKPEINQRMTKKAILKEYTEEIEKLKRDLMATRDKNGIYLAEDTYNDMLYKMESQAKELNDKVLYLKAIKDELAAKTKCFEDTQYHLEVVSENLAKSQDRIRITEADLVRAKKNLKHSKKKVEEKTFLLSQHMKTETLLTNQAKELIYVADTASSDTKGLHESIDRRKFVEEKVRGACEQLTGSMSDNIHHIKVDVQQLTKVHQEKSNSIVQDLSE